MLIQDKFARNSLQPTGRIVVRSEAIIRFMKCKRKKPMTSKTEQNEHNQNVVAY